MLLPIGWLNGIDAAEDNTMKGRVYLETTIPSYLTAWPSRDLIQAAHQQLTREWWEKRREQFELFISQVVLRECQAGDPTAAAARLEILQGLPLPEQTDEATKLAQALLQEVPLPERAAVERAAYCRRGGSRNGIPSHLELRILRTWSSATRSNPFAELTVTSRRQFAHQKNCYRRREIKHG